MSAWKEYMKEHGAEEYAAYERYSSGPCMLHGRLDCFDCCAELNDESPASAKEQKEGGTE